MPLLVLFACACLSPEEVTDPDSLAPFPPRDDIAAQLAASRTAQAVDASTHPLDSSPLRLHQLADAISHPAQREAAVDSLFAWWQQEPDHLAIYDMVRWRRNLHRRDELMAAIIAGSSLSDSSHARGIYIAARREPDLDRRLADLRRAWRRSASLRPVEQLLVEIRIAQTLAARKEVETALALLIARLARARTLGGATLEARLWQDTGGILRNAGHSASAIHAYGRAAELYAERKLHERELSCRMESAVLLYQLEGTRRSHAQLEAIVEEARSAGLPNLELLALNRLSSLYQSLDDYETALAMDWRSVELGLQLGIRRYLPRPYLNIADGHMRLARLDSAWVALREAERWLAGGARARDQWAFLTEQADFWLLKGEFARADSVSRAAEQLGAGLPPSDEDIIYLLRRSELGRVTGRPRISTRALALADSLLPRIGRVVPGVDFHFEVELEAARLGLETGAYDRARGRLSAAQSSLELHPSSERSTRFWNARGMLDRVSGDNEGALLALNEALESAAACKLPAPILRQELALARLELDSGNLAAARGRVAEFESAALADLPERLRLEGWLLAGEIDAAAGSFTAAAANFQGVLDEAGSQMPQDLAVRFRIELAGALEQEGRPAEALEAAREAFRLLSRAQNEAGASELRLVAAGATREAGLIQIRLLAAHPELAGKEDLAALSFRLRLEMLALGYGEPAAAELFSWQGPGAAYLLDEMESYLWILGRQGIRLERLPGREFIESRARSLQRACAAAGRSIPQEAATELAALILAPLGEDWPAGAPLLVLPDGALHGLPWALLRWASARVLDHAPVIISTGLSPLEDEMQPLLRGQPLMALGFNGEPSRDHILLNFAEEEAASIASLWTGPSELRVGEEARAELLSRKTGRARLIHLSVHAQMHQGVSDRAYLRFASADPDDPPLSVQDIRGLGLDTELVFLSCCEASRGAFSRSGPILDLSVAFTRAGARHVIASPVRVDDEASRFITPEFYRQLQAGQGVPEALRRTQLKFRDEKGSWSHPYYWANYQHHR